MDHSHRPLADDSTNAIATELHPPNKRPLHSKDEPPTKKLRPSVEVPAIYSDAVRKKLASTTRTGQACDRCKERKMKCDTNPVACQPCKQKNLQCYTTDRVTGQPRERGQTDRAETELQTLRDQNAAYQRKYGPLQPDECRASPQSSAPESSKERTQYPPPPPPPPPERDKGLLNRHLTLPDAQYIGWPAPSHTEPLHRGPMNGTSVDILDGVIDIADFPCEAMDEFPIHELNRFNMSRTSVMNTLTGYQNISNPRFPSKEQAIQDANTFLLIMSQYVPILHRPSFIKMIHRIYDHPSTVTQPERVQLAVVLGMIEQQTGVRNHRESAEKFEQSHYHIHYALTYYRELLRERSLASMQALALILVHFRNLPKPGYTWGFGHEILIKAMELEYHRDPEKIRLPPAEDNVLAKELRKRVFHSILGICVTTGCRVGRPAPWQFCHIDVPLPMAIKDSDISEHGWITPLSGGCDFWPCIQLAKLLPLLTEMYNHVVSVRRTEQEYVRTVEILHSKIDDWRRDWDELIRHEEKQINLNVATLLVEGWAAEYVLNLYHPSLCPTRSPDIMERHLDICHKQAQRLLKSFHILSNKYKGVDFTWHSTVAYALGFGVTLHVYKHRKARVPVAQFDSMRNEMKGWMSLMAYADLVLRTGNHLQHIFEPRVQRLEIEYQELIYGTPTDQFQPQQNSMPRSMSNRTSVKPEPSPYPSPSPVVTNDNHVRQTQHPHDVTMLQYQQGQPSTNGQQWGHTVQYTPQPSGVSSPYVPQTSGVAHTFTPYTTQAPQYSNLPTSLAPLLNDHASGYMTYPPPTTNPSNELMMFHPGHYTDGPAGMMWPIISLPPQDQNDQLDPNGNMKYN